MGTACCKESYGDHSKHKHMCFHKDGTMHEITKNTECEHKGKAGFENHIHMCLHEAYEHEIQKGGECPHTGIPENHIDFCVHSDGKKHEISNSECCNANDDCDANDHGTHKHICQHSEYKHLVHEVGGC